MNKGTRNLVFGLVAVVVVIGAAALAYIYFSGGSGQASAPISAPTLPAGTTASSSAQRFAIDSAKSSVQFTLTEDLFGKPNTVVGKTNQVAGSISVDVNQPANSQVGAIRINARTLATDSDMRDRMTRSQILGSSQDQFEYIDFAPTGISGLPAKIEAGQSYTFQIAGNLTVKGVTKPVTFSTTAKLVAGSPASLQGTATATVRRADYNLQIPNVPTVANVSDEIKLQIDFVATAA